MPQHYEYEEYVRTRRESPRRDRDHSPEYRSGGGSAREREENPRGSKDAFVREVMTLEHPQDSRPRSVPPLDPHQMARRRSPSPDLYYQSRSPSRAPSGRRHRRDSSSSQVSRRRDRSESPMTRAKSAIDDSFTRSTTGIGASILGAVAGGLAARQAGEVLARRSREKEGGHRRRSDAEKDDRIRLASTIIGAAMAGWVPMPLPTDMRILASAAAAIKTLGRTAGALAKRCHHMRLLVAMTLEAAAGASRTRI
uniref:Uncharacterized protein n=1 Tax=Bionectria ochroleuca TaxID=29856 RepID=A0A8H7K3V8_BIOOC